MKDLLLHPLKQDPIEPLTLQSRQGLKARSFYRADKIGVWASVFCALHCAVTPLIMLVAPAFGGIWAHPASHWGAALLVVPLAGLTMVQGYLKHRQKWILASGSIGICFLVLGAILPFLEISSLSPMVLTESLETVFVYEVGNHGAIAECQDSCCPSIQHHVDGTSRLHLPPASIVTTIGGIALILTHLGNICRCKLCQNRV